MVGMDASYFGRVLRGDYDLGLQKNKLLENLIKG